MPVVPVGPGSVGAEPKRSLLILVDGLDFVWIDNRIRLFQPIGDGVVRREIKMGEFLPVKNTNTTCRSEPDIPFVILGYAGYFIIGKPVLQGIVDQRISVIPVKAVGSSAKP